MKAGETLVITDLLANDEDLDGDPTIAVPSYSPNGPTDPSDVNGYSQNLSTAFTDSWNSNGGFTFTARSKGDGSFEPSTRQTYEIYYQLYESAGHRERSAIAKVTVFVEPADAP